jgi:hypothetical protein
MIKISKNNIQLLLMDFELWQLPPEVWQLPLELWQLPLELWQLPLELWLTFLGNCFCVLTIAGISSALSDSLIRHLCRDLFETKAFAWGLQPHQTASSDSHIGP